jgi:hypothetical protein
MTSPQVSKYHYYKNIFFQFQFVTQQSFLKIRSKDAKAPPHSVAASSREHKDVGDDAGGDGSGSS